MQITELHVHKADITSMAAVTREIVLGDGEALFRIERFALTANNVTYAAHGVDLRYWEFYPSADGFGIVPVWGFAQVVDSKAPGIAVGDRFYGYWPMASHAHLLPGRISPRGFSDTAAHRLALPQVYNNYVPASAAMGPETLQSLFRPLYTTSFVLDAMLSDSSAKTLLLTSASSKTALGLAQAARGRQRIIGLTSPANRAFVEATGYYDAIIDYGDAAVIAALDGPVALVDFSGNGAVRRDVHEQLGDRLIESHIVGDTHWAAENGAPLPGVRPQGFFAPTVIVDRVRQWGSDGFDQRLGAAWGRFIDSTGWLTVVEDAGPAAVIHRWQAMARGRIDPAEGLVLSI